MLYLDAWWIRLGPTPLGLLVGFNFYNMVDLPHALLCSACNIEREKEKQATTMTWNRVSFRLVSKLNISSFITKLTTQSFLSIPFFFLNEPRVQHAREREILGNCGAIDERHRGVKNKFCAWTTWLIRRRLDAVADVHLKIAILPTHKLWLNMKPYDSRVEIMQVVASVLCLASTSVNYEMRLLCWSAWQGPCSHLDKPRNVP